MSKCIISTRSGTDGYPRIRKNGQLRYEHNVVFEENFGEIPKGMIVTHSCDVRACINKNHLFLGTHQSNAKERVARGKQGDITGEKNGRAILTDKLVKQLREEYKNGNISQRNLAKKYNLSLGCLTPMLARRTWKHVK